MHGAVVLAAQAGPDEGLVVFHRANEMAGKAIRFNLEQEGRPAGQLLAGTTLEIPLAPGTYTFTVRAPSIDGMDYLTLNIEAGKGFSLETDLGYSDEVLRLTGGYEADSDKYIFYLIGGAGGQTATGIDRTSVRLEIRSLDRNAWEAITYAHVDGKSTQVQSSRFLRR